MVEIWFSRAPPMGIRPHEGEIAPLPFGNPIAKGTRTRRNMTFTLTGSSQRTVMIWLSTRDRVCTYFDSAWRTFTSRCLEE